MGRRLIMRSLKVGGEDMNAENGAKIDNLELFDEVNEFVSIEKNESDFGKYEFIDLTSDEIKYLKSIIETLEKDEDIHLCARGDSKRSKNGKRSTHAEFMNNELYDFFIVGAKAKFHNEKPDETFHHTLNGRKIIDDIKDIVLKCNEVLWEKSDGNFPDQLILDIEYLPKKTKKVGNLLCWRFCTTRVMMIISSRIPV